LGHFLFLLCQFTADGSKEEHVVYVIAIPANRYDLLCMEGFARAIRIFLGTEKQPVRAAPLRGAVPCRAVPSH
jgi:hypothetical protein